MSFQNVMSFLKQSKAQIAVGLSLGLNIALIGAVVWQAHVISAQRDLIVQMYYALQFLKAICAGGQQ